MAGGWGGRHRAADGASLVCLAVPGRLQQLSTAVVPVILGLGVLALQRAGGVVMFDDEIGFLGEAVTLSARDTADPVFRGKPFYSAGYPALLAGPMSVIRADPWVVAVGVNLVLLAALGPLLRHIVRQAIPLSPAAATVAAIVGASAPAVLLQVPRAWTEVCLAVGFAAWTALALQHLRPGAHRWAVPVGLLTGALLSVHRRMLSVVVVTAILLVGRAAHEALLARRADADEAGRRAHWGWAVAGLAALAGSAAGALALDRYVLDRLYDGVTSGSRASKAEVLLTLDWVPTLAGHAWSMLATTAGLTGVGLLALAWFALRGEQRGWAAAVLASALGVTAISVVFLTNGIRADQLVYERYVSPVVPVLVAVGVASLLARTRSAWPSVLASAGALVALGAGLAATVADDRLRGNVQKMTVPTLVGLDVPTVGWGVPYARELHVLPITALALAGAVVAFALLRRGWGGGLAVVALWAGVLVLSSAGSLRPFLDLWEPVGRSAAARLEDEGAEVLQYAPDLRHEVRNVVQYRLGYPEVRLIELDSCPAEPLFLGPEQLEGATFPFEVVEVVPEFGGALYRARC